MIKKLDWDSEFFGRAICRYDLNDPDAFDFNMTESPFDSVYVFSDAPILKLETADGVFSDIKLTYKKPADIRKPDESLFLRPVQTLGLKSLFLQSGAFSRFKLDPVFKPRFEELYSRWMQAALDGAFDDLIVSTGSPEKPTSCLTLKKEMNALRIGIIAVDESARGKGIGTGLIDYASSKAHEFGYDSLIVSAQERNKQAMRFYEKQGFTIWKKEYIYHIHKDV